MHNMCSEQTSKCDVQLVDSVHDWEPTMCHARTLCQGSSFNQGRCEAELKVGGHDIGARRAKKNAQAVVQLVDLLQGRYASKDCGGARQRTCGYAAVQPLYTVGNKRATTRDKDLSTTTMGGIDTRWSNGVQA